jgi:carboxyl-terminal processing protease
LSPINVSHKIIIYRLALAAGILATTASNSAGAFTSPISDPAATYLHQALDLMKEHALHKKEIDWRLLEKTATAYAAGAQTTEDTYPAIAYACTRLEDHSSHLQMPIGTSPSVQQRVHAIEVAATSTHGESLTSREKSPFVGRSVLLQAMLTYQGKRYAYVAIPMSNRAHTEYADAGVRHQWAKGLFNVIAQTSQQGAGGWILDLRGNTGGYLPPMLAGLWPFLDGGNVLEVRGPASKTGWAVHKNAVVTTSGFHRTSIAEVLDENMQIDLRQAPVAVLIDRNTESAAESLAIAFVGRQRTTFIGERTAGLTTSGDYWNLPDGAVLSIMSQQVYDRHGKAFPEGIEPNIQIPEPSTTPVISKDAAVLAAEKWLSLQP